jgi:hypothetical protein
MDYEGHGVTGMTGVIYERSPGLLVGQNQKDLLMCGREFLLG